MVQFDCIWLSKGHCYSVYPKNFVLVLSGILLHGIVQNFAFNMLTLKDDINIFFADTD